MPRRPSRPLLIAHLAEEIQKRSAMTTRGTERRLISTAWGHIGQGMHEWFADSPPLCIFSDLARCVAEQQGSPQHDDDEHRMQCRAGARSNCTALCAALPAVVWIGRACRPFAALLAQNDARTCRGVHGSESRATDLLRRSIFVDLQRGQLDERVWAIDVALRCAAVAVVIADGRGIDMAASRRLQLAAEVGGAMLLAWKPGGEAHVLSAAHYRWRVTSRLSQNHRQRWWIEQLRCKDAFSPRDGSRFQPCLVERNDATGRIAVSAEVVDRPCATPPARISSSSSSSTQRCSA